MGTIPKPLGVIICVVAHSLERRRWRTETTASCVQFPQTAIAQVRHWIKRTTLQQKNVPSFETMQHNRPRNVTQFSIRTFDSKMRLNIR